MSMNNFEQSLEELFTGSINWFGATSPEVAHLDPMLNQFGLTDGWPDAFTNQMKATSIKGAALLTSMLFPTIVAQLERAEWGDFTFTISMSGNDGIEAWLGPHTESEAFVGLNKEARKRWAFIGVSPNLAIGGFAIERVFSPLGYSVDQQIKTIVQLAPLDSIVAPSVAHLAPAHE